jgi:stage III sporulation protein AC
MGSGVDLIFKIAAIGIITALLHIILKNSQREELALMTSIAGVVVVVFMLMYEISTLFDTIKLLFGL